MGTAIYGGAEEIAAAILNQRAIGKGPVRAVEGGDGSEAAAGRDLEDSAITVRAAVYGSTEKIAAGILDHCGVGIVPLVFGNASKLARVVRTAGASRFSIFLKLRLEARPAVEAGTIPLCVDDLTLAIQRDQLKSMRQPPSTSFEVG